MAENVEVPKLTLAKKILAIQAAAGMVKKKGKFDSQMGGGGYLRIEDAVLAVGKLMYQQGLLLSGTLLRKSDGSFYLSSATHKVDKGYIVNVIVEWTLEDSTTGEKRIWHLPGDGYDGTDKAVCKALTGSRKYALIFIFNLAVGNDAEATGAPSFDESKNKQRAVAANTIAEKAAAGNKTAIDALSQIEPDKALIIHRPEEMNGHYIFATGLTAVPALQKFFSDTGCKWLKSKTTGKDGWRVPAEYEKGLLALCEKLKIDVE